jgi:hypothetical protein
MISEIQAKQIATAFVNSSFGRDLPLLEARYQNDPGIRARVHGLILPSELRRPCWAVSFLTVLDDGNVMADATIVDVDAENGQARFFEAWWQRARRALPSDNDYVE